MNETMIHYLCIPFTHATPINNDSPPSNQIIDSKNLALNYARNKKNSPAMAPLSSKSLSTGKKHSHFHLTFDKKISFESIKI
ncbi:hypothetical protein RHMOL_Rhmol04G0179500 [Rhododendron molle]|uniref:Uncharacterized protein n=1 Tax=Rhododendron molle TaxID=49168 RepID=A0ACC0P437_RHOML|nr:hypothetical protein RHMOL_Rhmol04G0179500 [Rhododendron molle]